MSSMKNRAVLSCNIILLFFSMGSIGECHSQECLHDTINTNKIYFLIFSNSPMLKMPHKSYNIIPYLCQTNNSNLGITSINYHPYSSQPSSKRLFLRFSAPAHHLRFYRGTARPLQPPPPTQVAHLCRTRTTNQHFSGGLLITSNQFTQGCNFTWPRKR